MSITTETLATKLKTALDEYNAALVAFEASEDVKILKELDAADPTKADEILANKALLEKLTNPVGEIAKNETEQQNLRKDLMKSVGLDAAFKFDINLYFQQGGGTVGQQRRWAALMEKSKNLRKEADGLTEKVANEETRLKQKQTAEIQAKEALINTELVALDASRTKLTGAAQALVTEISKRDPAELTGEDENTLLSQAISVLKEPVIKNDVLLQGEKVISYPEVWQPATPPDPDHQTEARLAGWYPQERVDYKSRFTGLTLGANSNSAGEGLEAQLKSDKANKKILEMPSFEISYRLEKDEPKKLNEIRLKQSKAIDLELKAIKDAPNLPSEQKIKRTRECLLAHERAMGWQYNSALKNLLKEQLNKLPKETDKNAKKADENAYVAFHKNYVKEQKEQEILAKESAKQEALAKKTAKAPPAQAESNRPLPQAAQAAVAPAVKERPTAKEPPLLKVLQAYAPAAFNPKKACMDGKLATDFAAKSQQGGLMEKLYKNRLMSEGTYTPGTPRIISATQEGLETILDKLVKDKNDESALQGALPIMRGFLLGQIALAKDEPKKEAKEDNKQGKKEKAKEDKKQAKSVEVLTDLLNKPEMGGKNASKEQQKTDKEAYEIYKTAHSTPDPVQDKERGLFKRLDDY